MSSSAMSLSRPINMMEFLLWTRVDQVLSRDSWVWQDTCFQSGTMSYTVSSSSLGSQSRNGDGRWSCRTRTQVSDGDMASGVVCPSKWMYYKSNPGTRKRSGTGVRSSKKCDFGTG